MCSSCGCGIPEELHADPRNILWSQICAAAEAQRISVNDVVNNIHTMVHESHKVDQKPQPEPIKDAKTKAAIAEMEKDWALWDAEHAAGVAGRSLAHTFQREGMHIQHAVEEARARSEEMHHRAQGNFENARMASDRAKQHRGQWEKHVAQLSTAAQRAAHEHRAKQLERYAPKAVSADLTKDWALWDAERAAEAAGLGHGFGHFSASHMAIVRGAVQRAYRGFKDGSSPHQIDFAHRGIEHSYTSNDGKKWSHSAWRHSTNWHRGSGPVPKDVSHLLSQHLKNHTKKEAHTKNAALRQTVMTMSDVMVDAVEKGQRRNETGQFHPGTDNVHSHKMGDEILTHSHEGDPKHTHPTRKYGPSFHHR